jgi:hypothetical protein
MFTEPPPDPAPRLVAVSEVAVRPVDWLWPHRLGRGKLALLEGDPGLSKSFVALDLCARLSSGRPWPDGAPAPDPAACIFLNGEDGVEDTLGPRLAALGADLGRVFVVDRGTDDLAAALSLPDQAAALGELVARVRARLLVIDPVMPFFGAGVNTGDDRSVRRALAPLAALARHLDCAVLLIRHLAKHGQGPAVRRGLGAIGLVGACRSAWLVAEEEEGSPRRVLAQVKNNLAAPQPSLAFEVAQPAGGAPTLTWLGPVAALAHGLLARRRQRGPEAVALAGATAFLARVLADGPRPVRVIWALAQQEGHSRRTLRRAKTEVEADLLWADVDGHPVRHWALPGQTAPPPAPAEDDETSLEPWLAPLRERYPGPTPLDDL